MTEGAPVDFFEHGPEDEILGTVNIGGRTVVVRAKGTSTMRDGIWKPELDLALEFPGMAPTTGNFAMRNEIRRTLVAAVERKLGPSHRLEFAIGTKHDILVMPKAVEQYEVEGAQMADAQAHPAFFETASALREKLSAALNPTKAAITELFKSGDDTFDSEPPAKESALAATRTMLGTVRHWRWSMRDVSDFSTFALKWFDPDQRRMDEAAHHVSPNIYATADFAIPAGTSSMALEHALQTLAAAHGINMGVLGGRDGRITVWVEGTSMLQLWNQVREWAPDSAFAADTDFPQEVEMFLNY